MMQSGVGGMMPPEYILIGAFLLLAVIGLFWLKS
jgi:hypothetical protein